jgi:hypothetical protein
MLFFIFVLRWRQLWNKTRHYCTVLDTLNIGHLLCCHMRLGVHLRQICSYRMHFLCRRRSRSDRSARRFQLQTNLTVESLR